jgi:biopolymer transport protein ExbB
MIRRLIAIHRSILPLLLLVASGALAESAPTDLAQAIFETKTQIETARQDLVQTQHAISQERLTLAGELETLRQQVTDLRQELSSGQNQHQELLARQSTLEKDNQWKGKLLEYAKSATTDYRQASETRLSPAEAEHLRDALADIDRKLAAPPEDSTAALQAVLELANQHAVQAVSGRAFEGAALDLSGRQLQGKFRQFGPLSYFSGVDQQTAGPVFQRPGSLLPSVFAKLPESTRQGIASLVSTGVGTVPVDPTLGTAIKLDKTRDSIVTHLRKGGATMIPLLMLALVCAALSIYKLVSLVGLMTSSAEQKVVDIINALRAGEPQNALVIAEKLRRPIGPVIRTGILHREAEKEHLEEIMYEQILSQVPLLERFLSPLAVCASVAPLLGLLGTVTGMIHTFNLITVFGTGDAKLLSGGISEALITTEVGLMIAVPALLIHAYLSRRVRRAVALTQQTAIMFVNATKLLDGGQ